ncbi:DUF711 family protein [Gammaproteobacteria bacterium]|nr:DUF711 family protein [Gammaproteobacteria bacterium]
MPISTIGIRTLTVGFDHAHQDMGLAEEQLSSFNKYSLEVFSKVKRAPRTYRIAMNPVIPGPKMDLAGAMSYVNWTSNICTKLGFRWFCLPIKDVDAGNSSQAFDIGLECLRRHKNVFLNVIVSKGGEISLPAVKTGAKLIKAASRLSDNGFDNFRLGVSSNCKVNTPFFPFAEQSGTTGFSIGLELPQFLNRLISNHNKEDLITLRKEIIENLLSQLNEIQLSALDISNVTGLEYHGMDISLAPYPEDHGSVGELIERVSTGKFGSHGTIFAISFFTDILKTIVESGEIKTVGFNGVMLSLLEDESLSYHNRWKLFSLDSLLAYSSVCGCGLDMIPLPGDILEEELRAIILDTAGMSIRLDKPLGVRLLPIIGEGENEITNYNFDFIYNSRVLGTKGIPADFDLLFKSSHFSYSKSYENNTKIKPNKG